MYEEYKEAWAELISAGADFEIEKIEITWYIKTNESRIAMHIKSWTHWLPGSSKMKSLMATESQ